METFYNEAEIELINQRIEDAFNSKTRKEMTVVRQDLKKEDIEPLRLALKERVREIGLKYPFRCFQQGFTRFEGENVGKGTFFFVVEEITLREYMERDVKEAKEIEWKRKWKKAFGGMPCPEKIRFRPFFEQALDDPKQFAFWASDPPFASGDRKVVVISIQEANDKERAEKIIKEWYKEEEITVIELPERLDWKVGLAQGFEYTFPNFQ